VKAAAAGGMEGIIKLMRMNSLHSFCEIASGKARKDVDLWPKSPVHILLPYFMLSRLP